MKESQWLHNIDTWPTLQNPTMPLFLSADSLPPTECRLNMKQETLRDQSKIRKLTTHRCLPLTADWKLQQVCQSHLLPFFLEI